MTFLTPKQGIKWNFGGNMLSNIECALAGITPTGKEEMSHAELVKRLQTGHDSHCAMSYGMHEHCCDCSFPDRAEAVATIEQLQADLAAARAEVERLQASERSAWNAAVDRDAHLDVLMADLAAARTLLKDCLPELDGEGVTIHRVWKELAKEPKRHEHV